MLLPDGYHDIPHGSLAAVVTYLEMTAAAPARPERAEAPWTLRPVAAPGLDWYRDLYRRVGAEWLWSSRLSLTDADLADVLGAPGVVVHALVMDGSTKAISNSISLRTWRALGTRAGSEVVGEY